MPIASECYRPHHPAELVRDRNVLHSNRRLGWAVTAPSTSGAVAATGVRMGGYGRGFNGREHLRHVAAHFPELGVRLDEPLQRSKDGVAKRLAIAAAVVLHCARQTLVHWDS